MESNLTPGTKGTRGAGWVLVILGPLLSVAMAVIAFFLWRTIHYPGQLGNTTRWTGGPEMTARTFQLFCTIFFFGLGCILAGIFQIRTGRRSIVLVVIMLLLVGVMFYLGRQITRLAV
jgi:hypothetical protein